MIRNKIGRNDPCHCDSGLKYKKCCLKSKQIESEALPLRQTQAELKQKVRDNLFQEVRFLDTDSEPIKMSAVILEFAADMLRHSDTRAERKQAIDIACFAWNLALFKEKDNAQYKSQLNSFLKQMGIKNQSDRNEIQLLISALVDKKIREYPMIDRFIVHYQVNFKKDELMLHIASAFSTPETDEITQESD
jgi:SEC-C motif